MNTEKLSVEQEQFLEQCEIEFVDRYSACDKEYINIYKAGISSPPIMFPWYGRFRFNNDRQGCSGNEGHHQRTRGYHRGSRQLERSNYNKHYNTY